MKVKRVKPTDAKTERYIATALIVSDYCCRETYPIYQAQLFQSTFGKTVASWCMDYYSKYEQAPKEQIEHLFDKNKDYMDEDLADSIESFLESISDEYERSDTFNEKYWMDYAEDYFQKRAYTKLAEDLKDAAEQGVDKAEDIYSKFIPVARNFEEGADVLTEENIQRLQYEIDEDFNGGKNYLFRLPGEWGKLVGDIERDSFLAFLGREKVGKSYILEEIGIRAAQQKCNVVYFSTGDMSENQFDKRFYSRITGKYHRKEEGEWWKPVLDCKCNQNGKCEYGDEGIIIYDSEEREVGMKFPDEFPDHEPCTDCLKERKHRKNFEGNLWWVETPHKHWEWSEALDKTERFNKIFRGKFYRVCWPMESASFEDIKRWLVNKREREGFVPDVVIVDYADIMLPPVAYQHMEKRHQEDGKWKALRGLSQEFHCAVFTATQSDAKGYRKKSLTLDNFNEAKSKYGHVTHFYSLNRTENEDLYKVIRIGELLVRESELHVTKEITILQGIYAGRPYLDSFVGRAVGI